MSRCNRDSTSIQQSKADSEIEEEHLLNFVVNSLDEELAIDLGENVEVTTAKLYEVLDQSRLRDD